VIFGTELTGALYVSWAIPLGSLPPIPEPLVPDRHLGEGGELAFVTLVHFRQRGLHAEALPWPRFTYPQVNLRICARDGDGVPAVFILRELVPAWMVPLARVGGGQPASAALLDFPPSGSAPGGEALRWSFTAGERNAILARAGACPVGPPQLGGFPETVAFFRERPRAYAAQGGKLRRLETVHPRTESAPAAVEIESSDWLAAQFPEVERSRWLSPHSAFFVPSTRMLFELSREAPVPMVEHVPAPG
jgi:uncharacterized protein YqjF (DUF2071 family)